VSIYSERLLAHLAQYKTARLGIAEEGTWARTGRPYPHILPAGQLEQNVLPSLREAFWPYARTTGVKLHRDFHHLNSSQAFAFNLFFAFFRPGGDPGALLVALELPNRRVAHWGLESVLDADEGSNFDVHWAYADGGAVVCEVKLSESGFGAARRDPTHLEKLERIYRKRLAGKVVPGALEDAVFFTNYQLMRNIAFADPDRDQHAVFVLPRANASLKTTLETFIDSLVSPRLLPFVHVAFIEDVLTRLAGAAVGKPEVQTIVEQLQEKYLPPAS
jgi:hypothetical protein